MRAKTPKVTSDTDRELQAAAQFVADFLFAHCLSAGDAERASRCPPLPVTLPECRDSNRKY